MLRVHTTLIIVQLLAFFPVEQQSEAFSAKAFVNNSGLILFAAVSKKQDGPLNGINGFLPRDLIGRGGGEVLVVVIEYGLSGEGRDALSHSLIGLDISL